MLLQRTKWDRLIDSLFYAILACAGLATLFPIYYVIMVSVTPIAEVIKHGGFVLWPDRFTWSAYTAVLRNPIVPQSLKITVIVTVVGTSFNLLITMLLAYPLSRKSFPARNLILVMIVFTMIFSGGLIPTYLVVKSTGLLNSLWALIIPTAISTFNMLIMKTFFEQISEEVQDAAKIDGCNDMQTLFRIIVPLSVPIFSTLGLFYAVSHWNEYFQGLMYLSDPALYPIQIVLRNMLQQTQLSQELLALNPGLVAELPPETLRMAVVVIAMLPVMLIYPFIQKHFTKGMMLGAIKG